MSRFKFSITQVYFPKQNLLVLTVKRITLVGFFIRLEFANDCGNSGGGISGTEIKINDFTLPHEINEIVIEIFDIYLKIMKKLILIAHKHCLFSPE